MTNQQHPITPPPELIEEMTKPYSHLHSIWKAEEDSIRAEMIARGEDPDAPPPGKIIKPYALHEGGKFRLPTFNMADKHLRCWWWNSNKNHWKFEFRLVIGTGALDEDDCIKSQSQVYHKDSAIKLITKGITHFIPYIENCPPLIFGNPFDDFETYHD